MDASSFAFLTAAAAAVGLALLIYQRRELNVRGRWLLAGLRALVLVLALLLIWNPQLPGDLAPQTAADTWVLLDRSLSMGQAQDGEAVWEGAVETARDLARGGARVATFGATVEPGSVDLLDGLVPDAPLSRLAAALERAAEAGARRIVVVSDLRIQDPAAARAVLERTRAEVSFRVVGGPVRNAGVAEVVAPTHARPGEPLALEVVVQGGGGAEGDSVTLDVREGDRLLASERHALPAQGLRLRSVVSVDAPSREGPTRFRVAVRLEGDAFPADDARTVHVEVGPLIRGVALVSLRPDWEPRFLLPVLQQVTGLSARGYLRLSDGRYLLAGGGTDERALVEEDEVQRAVGGAELLVLHGVGQGAPEWVTRAARAAGRLLILAHDPAGAALGGARVAVALPGEWYPAPQLPPSPLAADLSGADFSGLPPLESVLPTAPGPGAAPLNLLRDGAGRPEAALALVQENGRRRATMLARGFWRWSFREGPPREAYRRLWAAVSGWLLASERVATGPGVRPVPAVVPRHDPPVWQAPGLAGDTLRLRVDGEDGPVADTLVVVPPGESFRTNPLPPGEYSFTVDRGPGSESEGSGVLDVEAFTEELLLSPAALDSAASAGQAAAGAAAPPGRPFRTHPGPYLLIVAFLCAEWIGRRRLGLR